ncbi:hypothetical protein DAEQUDRAFT_769224 [Daedalea quercina L-15889]|uniref:MICOS complex subunit MIC12 n=1 Tax=Daedalea quercina L-15889 TaxID=1314783 RepID=A0A165LXT5_9APHY|nr:hypothetical protein DAEQUDRAFT_769224 [Daedalea quercina L-15889]
MSFLIGPVSGALAAGGVYYGFSTMIQTRTEKHRSDLRALSRRLVEADSIVPAPPPAAERISQRPFTTLLKHQWNTQVEALFRSAGDWDRRVVGWGRRVLYGGDASTSDGAQAR